jgi:hypothetical protein
MKSREQLFIKEGVSAEVARIAAEASYIPPKNRTPEQKGAIHLIRWIAANNRVLGKDHESL